jgi:hypothetical protein
MRSMIVIASAAAWLAFTSPGHADEFEESVAKRAEVLANTNYTRLGTCQDLMRDLYEWGVLDEVATGIALGVTDKMAKMVKHAEAAGNDQLRRGSAGFLIGFCTAIVHIHMANLDHAESVPDSSRNVTGPVLQSRAARLQRKDTFDPDYCRGHIRKLRDVKVIDEAADVMLLLELNNAIEQGTSGTPREDTSQGFGYGLCSAVLNAMMSAVQ